MIKTPLVFQENKPLSEFSTFGIGGPARLFIEVREIQEMQAVLLECDMEKTPYIVIGKGSNCLFDDRGFDGLVILNKINFFTEPSPGEFHVGAGYSFSLLGAQTAKKKWTGLEFASGIPGSVGGAVFMNAGANGKETCESLTSVDYIDTTGKLHELKKDQLQFSYRTSSFQNMKGAIVGAKFTLSISSTAREDQLKIIDYRKKTQPYSDKSVGCFFRNPDCHKAGAIIDECGLKGFRYGNAEVSDLHANFIVNKGNASCSDVLSLMDQVKNRVKEMTGIELESEARIIPYQLPTNKDD